MRIVRDKVKEYSPKRYCIFFKKIITSLSDIEKIQKDIIGQYKCQLIINGISPTIKHYLRLISDKNIFLNLYDLEGCSSIKYS